MTNIHTITERNKNCFEVTRESSERSWEDSQAQCTANSAYLAMPTDEQFAAKIEDVMYVVWLLKNFVKQIFLFSPFLFWTFSAHARNSDSWVGLRWNTLPAYEYVNGFVPYTYGDHNSSPQDSKPCIFMKSDGVWDALECDKDMKYVCEKPLGK